MMNSTTRMLGSPAVKQIVSPLGSLSSLCSTTVGDNSPTNSQETSSSYGNLSSYSKTSSSSLMNDVDATQLYSKSCVRSTSSTAAKTYGPVRKIPAAACTTLSSPLGLAPRYIRQSESGDTTRPAPFKFPNFNLRPKYIHSENAMIFLIMAAKLIEPDGPPVHQSQPIYVFRREANDPPIKSQVQQPFADRVANAMRCKYSCYVLALIYLQNLKAKHPEKMPVTHITFQRLLVASIIVAAKFYDDLYYSNEHYAKELGFPLETVNHLEVCFLVLQDFELRVDTAEFQHYHRAFDATRKSLLKNKAWCGLNNAEIGAELTAVLPRGSNFTCTSPDELRCSAALFVQATITGGFRNHHNPIPAANASRLERLVNDYLASREYNGWRYDSEEEFLFKSALQSRSRVINTLLQQYYEEIGILYRKGPDAQKVTTTTTTTITNTELDFAPAPTARPQMGTRRR